MRLFLLFVINIVWKLEKDDDEDKKNKIYKYI